MEFKVIFREAFLEDLQRLVESISHNDPSAAVKLGEAIIAASETLSKFPERFPRLRSRRGIRRVIVKRHFKVFYRVLTECSTVEVLRCWDGRRISDPRFGRPAE